MHLKRYYNKEEEFLEEFYNVASVAASFLNGEWSPKNDCNDDIRQQQKYFLSTGELSQLVFDSAAVHHDAGGFFSVQIVLRSYNRVVTVQVKKVGEDLVAEKLVDKPSNASSTNRR